MLWFSKGCCSHNFHPQFQSNFKTSMVIRGNTGYGLFWGAAKIIKIWWRFEMFLNTGPCGAGNFKMLLFLQFWSNVNQTSWGNNMAKYKLFSWLSFKSFKNFVALCNFSIGVNRKIIKCKISWKRLAEERNGGKIGTRGPICRVHFGSRHLSSVWGHSVHFVIFLMLRFAKNVAVPPVFIQFQPNLAESMHSGKYRLFTFSGYLIRYCHILKVYGSF